MGAPNFGDMMPPDMSWFARRIEDLQRQVNELRSARTLEASVIGDGGMTSANFDGAVDPPAVGTQGWALTGKTGTLIVNEILLRDQIIGDDALQHPIRVAIANGSTPSLTLTTTPTILHSEYLTVPSGFSQALVMATCSVGATSPSGGGVLSGYAAIAPTSGDTISTAAVGASTATSLTAVYAQVVTGLSGGTIQVAVIGYGSSSGWTGGNGHVSAIAIFLR